MEQFRYERLVVGYHGCDRTVRDRVLFSGKELLESDNDYDWLGRGIYFWEYGRERAEEWAVSRKALGKLNEPSVIGALMYLGNCFDLLDVRFTRYLGEAYKVLVKSVEDSGKNLPKNSQSRPDDPDFLLRRGDCTMMNWSVDRYEFHVADTVPYRARLVSGGRGGVSGISHQKEESHPNCGPGYRLHPRLLPSTVSHEHHL